MLPSFIVSINTLPHLSILLPLSDSGQLEIVSLRDTILCCMIDLQNRPVLEMYLNKARICLCVQAQIAVSDLHVDVVCQA